MVQVSEWDLYAVVAEVVRARAIQEPAPVLEIATSATQSRQPLEVRADADRLAAVISHVVQNAQEATPRDGQVIVRVGRIDTQAVIEVRDTGLGMDAEFVRERLFKPFDSTKGLTGMGVGAYEARELIIGLGGRVVVDSVPGKGTLFRFFVPIEAPEAEAGVAVSAG